MTKEKARSWFRLVTIVAIGYLVLVIMFFIVAFGPRGFVLGALLIVWIFYCFVLNLLAAIIVVMHFYYTISLGLSGLTHSRSNGSQTQEHHALSTKFFLAGIGILVVYGGGLWATLVLLEALMGI